MTNLLDSHPETASTDVVSRGSTASTVRRRPPATNLDRFRALRATRWGDAGIAGVFGLVVTLAFSWVPSIWYDESATIVSAQRTWAQLWAEIHTVDAVHAVYYALMHVWFAVVGYSPFSLRFPSAVATGVAAALVVLLARELANKRTGIVAGVLFVLLPRVTWMGGEGRSYATATALATALTLVFVHATKKTRSDPGRHARWWLLYGLLALASSAIFLYSALVVVAHGVTLALWAWRSRRAGRTTPWRPAFAGWIIASLAAGLLLLPLANLASGQSKQVGWLSKPDITNIWQFFITQWFSNNLPFAILGWGLVVVGIVVVWRRGARHHLPNVLQVTLPWMLVPVLGLLFVSSVDSPLYSPRYVTFGAPTVAILMAVGLTSIRARSWVAAGLVLSIGLTLPTYVAQRLPEAKDNSSWKEVAGLISQQRAIEGPNATDAIIYGHIRRHPTGSARNIAYAYPKAFSGMTDVTLKTPAAETGALWETRSPLSKTIERVDGHRYVWLVTSTKQDLRPSVTKELAAEGYHVEDQWHLTWVNVLRYTK